MPRKQLMMSLSVVSLVLGLFFLVNNQFVTTGGILGVTLSSTIGSVAGFAFLVLSGLLYLLRGEEEEVEL